MGVGSSKPAVSIAESSFELKFRSLNFIYRLISAIWQVPDLFQFVLRLGRAVIAEWSFGDMSFLGGRPPSTSCRLDPSSRQWLVELLIRIDICSIYQQAISPEANRPVCWQYVTLRQLSG